MGFRMKLCAGYGLDITGLPRDGLAYERLEDEDCFKAFLADCKDSMQLDDPEMPDRFTMDKIMIGLATRPGRKGDQREIVKDLTGLVEYEGEYGFENKLLLYPIGRQKVWRRSWNDLDSFVYEAYRENLDQGMEPEWREKPGTLYPITGLMRANAMEPYGVEEYWVNCYLNDPRHKDAVPKAPYHLWHLIKHLGLATEAADITRLFLSLRPTIYRFWS